MNKRYIHTLCTMLLAALSLTSCLKDDKTEVTLYDDMAITSFSLSTVNRYIHTTSASGADSIYKTTLTTKPVFTIDHYKQQIYNTDSLLADCDVTHILASISSKNNGQILLKSITSDSLTLYSSSDSIDFSKPRELRVYALDGSGYRAYTVTVNIRQTEAGVMIWQEMDPGNSEMPEAFNLEPKIQAGEGKDFRLSTDGGQTWTEEQIGEDEDEHLLPTENLAWVTFPYISNVNTHCEMLAGITQESDKTFTLWRKIVEENKGAETPHWVNIPTEDNKDKALPRTDSLSLVWLDGVLYAFGYTGTIYKSRDQGITWRVDGDFTLPEGMESNNVKAATDAEGDLWLLNTDSGKVWRGHVTK